MRHWLQLATYLYTRGERRPPGSGAAPERALEAYGDSVLPALTG